MKKIAMLLTIISLLIMPGIVSAQLGTTTTAFQVVNLSSTSAASVSIVFYNTSGGVVYTLPDTISAGSSKTYNQGDMGTQLGTTFNGSVIVSSDQQIAAIVNQNTTGAAEYNGSYTGFSQGSDTFYIPVVLNNYYQWTTYISVQNAGSSAVNVTVTYDTPGCTDSATNLQPGAAVRFDNSLTCSGGLSANGSATISAPGGSVVAVVNQISDSANKEQTYNGFAPADGGDTLYTPICLYSYYGFYSSMQIQNISGSAMNITATYSDGTSQTVNNVADGEAATFIQGNETHAANWSGSAVVSNNTGGDMVGIVNQSSSGGKASSFNMFAAGSQNWALPSLLNAYYGYYSSFQVQNISGSPINVSVTYSDATTASATNVADNDVATFIQGNESHSTTWAGSAAVSCTGNCVIVVNQDATGTVDLQYSYNGVPTN